MTNKQLAQRRAAACCGGKALVAKRGGADMAEIGRRSGKADFFDELRKAQALAGAVLHRR